MKSKSEKLKTNKLPIWAADCLSCKKGSVLLFEKGGVGKCNKCKKKFLTDYEEHPELGTSQNQYWIVEEATPFYMENEKLVAAKGFNLPTQSVVYHRIRRELNLPYDYKGLIPATEDLVRQANIDYYEALEYSAH